MSTLTTPYVNFQAQYIAERQDILALVDRVFQEATFVNGEEVEALERDLADYLGVEHVVALNSGTDALIFGLAALGVRRGDEVITPPNSFVASTAAICHLGGKPVFVDVLPDQNIDPTKIEAAITPRTKAIMPVHLTGRVADMAPILEIAAHHGLKVIEDAAQAIGSQYHGKMAGSLGDVGCFSLHPLKNLNAAGDGGFLTTNDAATAAMIRQRRSHGMIDRNTVVCWGGVSRLDTLQAALVRYRLGRLTDIIEKRRRNANLYRRLLPPIVYHPPCQPYEFNTFHTFVVQVPERDALQAYLTSAGIGSAIHYPVPIHLQPAAAQLGHKIGDFPVTETQAKHILSLPIHQYLHDDDIYHICDVIGQFFDHAVRAEVV